MKEEIVIEAIEFKAEYAECGSHLIKLTIVKYEDEPAVVDEVFNIKEK